MLFPLAVFKRKVQLGRIVKLFIKGFCEPFELVPSSPVKRAWNWQVSCESNRAAKSTLIRHAAVLETDVSRHHGALIKGPLKPFYHHGKAVSRSLREHQIGALLCQEAWVSSIADAIVFQFGIMEYDILSNKIFELVMMLFVCKLFETLKLPLTVGFFILVYES